MICQCDRLPDLLSETDSLPSLEGVSLNLSVEQVFDWLRRREQQKVKLESN
uniref:hypothetical protein n=1 Tax=Trichocoleus desertorum TaxID=1481672 RepID=UPI0025B4E86F|nr:hypothetical protein [Trichocoleus desertorum]